MIAEGFVDAGVKVYISSRKADVVADVAAELSEKGTCIGHPGRPGPASPSAAGWPTSGGA